jgi:hypothetical protein
VGERHPGVVLPGRRECSRSDAQLSRARRAGAAWQWDSHAQPVTVWRGRVQRPRRRERERDSDLRARENGNPRVPRATLRGKGGPRGRAARTHLEQGLRVHTSRLRADEVLHHAGEALPQERGRRRCRGRGGGRRGRVGRKDAVHVPSAVGLEQLHNLARGCHGARAHNGRGGRGRWWKAAAGEDLCVWRREKGGPASLPLSTGSSALRAASSLVGPTPPLCVCPRPHIVIMMTRAAGLAH